MVVTTTQTTTRSGDAAWVVTWGKGLTQTAVCLSKEEADSVAAEKLGYKGTYKRWADPLVSFRHWM